MRVDLRWIMVTTLSLLVVVTHLGMSATAAGDPRLPMGTVWSLIAVYSGLVLLLSLRLSARFRRPQ